MKYVAGTQPKEFAWSYSKLKNYRTCPKRYYEIDVTKNYQEDFTGEHLQWGNQVHKAFEERISKGTPFPKGMEHFEDAALRLLAVPGKVLTEQKLAIRRDLAPCTYFDKQTWFRGIADLLIINPPVALAIDYKTGKILEEAEQLALLAECVFSHYPDVHAVRTEFWWLKDDAATRQDFRRTKRKDTWRGIMPKVMELENAHKTMDFPPRTSGLCKKHCIVTGCPHNGKNSSR